MTVLWTPKMRLYQLQSTLLSSTDLVAFLVSFKLEWRIPNLIIWDSTGKMLSSFSLTGVKKGVEAGRINLDVYNTRNSNHDFACIILCYRCSFVFIVTSGYPWIWGIKSWLPAEFCIPSKTCRSDPQLFLGFAWVLTKGFSNVKMNKWQKDKDAGWYGGIMGRDEKQGLSKT